MNSENSPQSHANTTQSTSRPKANPTTGQPPVAAVIRLKRPLAGTDRDVRLDAAEPQKVRSPHMRTDQLNSYVSWLQQQQPVAGIPKAPRTKTRLVNNPVELPQVTLASQPTPPTDSTAPTPSTANAPSTAEAPTVPIESTQSGEHQSRGYSTERFQRVDQAHADAGSTHAAPTPNISASDFKFEADLARILNKLNMPEVLLPKPRQGCFPRQSRPARPKTPHPNLRR